MITDQGGENSQLQDIQGEESDRELSGQKLSETLC